MATYEYNNCGMVVNVSCAKCDLPLFANLITIDDGNKIKVYESPACEGNI